MEVWMVFGWFLYVDRSMATMVYDNLQAVKALIDCVRGPEMSMTLILRLLILDTCL